MTHPARPDRPVIEIQIDPDAGYMNDHSSVNRPGPDWADEFLELLETGVGMKRICEQIGISTKTVWQRREHDALFAHRYREAIEVVKLALEHEILDRALHGSPKSYTNKKGEVIETVEHDNRHLQWVAERIDPDKWNLDRQRGEIGDVTVIFNMGDRTPTTIELPDRPSLGGDTLELEAEAIDDAEIEQPADA